MKFYQFCRKLGIVDGIGMKFRKTFSGFMLISLAVLITLTISMCEGDDRFYRPNLPEKLCCIGIIDLDDTILRHISFEKSFQIEYPEEVNDSLREFSFAISSSTGDLFSYHSDSTIKSIKDLRIPDSIPFNPGEKYYLRAKEKDTPEISAEVVVPEPPSELTFISINKEITTLSEPQECTWLNTVKYAVINISFINRGESKQYYALLLEGTGYSAISSFPPGVSSLLDFSIRDCNSPGFFSVMHGLKKYHWICINNRLYLKESHVFAYFIEGSKIPDNRCNIIISTQFQDVYSIIDILQSIRIKLLSIPEELYLFEKSLYTYEKTSGDPFTEPVYLNGNIKGGNGVFAICRSTEISINLPFPPY